MYGLFLSPAALACAAISCATLVCAVVLAAVARRRRRVLESEADRLRDEIWELREAAAARDRAEAANEAKSRFLANVSHEVRTPLNGILGMAELLGGTAVDAEQKTYIAAIRTSGTALASLIDGMLDLSKIEAGRVDLVSEPFDAAELIDGVVELLAPRAQGKSLEIAATFASDVPRRLIGDPMRLRQILLNLAGNAIKFTDNGGVGVRVSRVPGQATGRDCTLQLRFDIDDTGIGIPEESRAAIFDQFEQVGADSGRRGGTGLGLAISRGLAEHMGGTLELAPPLQGRGSRFTLSLPFRFEELPRSNRVLGLGQRALVVANSVFEAPFVVERLREMGVHTTTVADLTDARETLAAQPPFDVVMVDCALGEATTRLVGEAARQAGTKRSFVLFSAFERRAFGQVSAQGFDGWLVKPIRQSRLVALVGGELFQPGPVGVAPKLPQAAQKARHILLAEDNNINALLAIRHLERLGATVVRASDGLQALELATAALSKGRPFDAILLDFRMPGLEGPEVARRFRIAEAAMTTRRTRIIALTADLLGTSLAARDGIGMDPAIDDWLSKPVSFAQIEQAYRTLADDRVPSAAEV